MTGLLSRFVELAYPTVDIVIVSLVLARAMRSSPGTRLPFAFLGGGLLLLSVTDTAFAAGTLNGTYQHGGIHGAGWTGAWLSVALAAFAPSRPPTAEIPRLRVAQELLPYVPIAAVIALGASREITMSAQPVLVGLGALVLSLAAVRQLVVALEHTALANDLEAKVDLRTAELRSQSDRFTSLVQNSSDVVSVIDDQGLIIYQSPAIGRMFGYDASRLTGTSWLERFVPEDEVKLHAALAGAAESSGGSETFETTVVDSGGKRRAVEVTVTNLLDDPSVGGLVINMREIAERKALEVEMRHQAFHDSLTGLANRAMFVDRVAHALAVSERHGRLVAVLFLDLDDFKEVNDSLGHTAGDELLAETARRLRELLRSSDTVARLGGDEFAILLEDVGHPEMALAVATRVLAALRVPLHLGEREIVTEVSIGIALCEDGGGVEDLLQNADTAMYVVKGRGKGGYASFTPDMRETALARLELVADLRCAVEQEDLEVHYQPKLSLHDGKLRGFEALVRWTHPGRGSVCPDEFIPLAEQAGLIGPLGRLVLRQACRQLATWHQEGADPGLTMAVNLSARQLSQADLVEDIAAVFTETGVQPASIELEITETAIMDDVQAAIPVLEALKNLGVSLAIDDFGTGYSSLNYLKRFPVNSLKIDRAFVNGLGRNGQDSALVAAVIALARALRMTSVAEGIETFEQLVELRALGCDEAQGFYLGRPAPAQSLGPVVFAPEPSSEPARTVGTVLVCDDDPLVRLVHSTAFRAEGVEVAEAADGVECLEKAAALQPDLVVLDLNMPNLDGMSTLAELRARSPHCLVVIVTSTPMDQLVTQGLGLGAAAFFLKAGFTRVVPHLLIEGSRLASVTA